MNKERRLGRGLEALLGRPLTDHDAPATLAGAFPAGENYAPALEVVVAETREPENGLVHLPVHDITPNRFQPRQDFDDQELEQLAESIRQHGVIQPIVVRHKDVGGYELISGERRLRAAIKAGWVEIPAWIRQADDQEVAEVAIIENVQRKDLNPVEKAVSFQRYLDLYGGTQADLAARIQVDRSTIGNLLRLLELPGEIQTALREEAITQGHARALLPLGDEYQQIDFCRQIVAAGLSVRATEELVTETIRQADAEPLAIAGSTAVIAGTASVTQEESLPRRGPKQHGTRSGHLSALEQELKRSLGTKVEIRETARHRGKIIIHFNNQNEFDRLRELLSEPAPGLQHGVG